ncbi:MAG: hypothetical protein HZC44_04415, partial [Geobacter sp.]|nr:hypothetical protein [Geobacter sp.]
MPLNTYIIENASKDMNSSFLQKFADVEIYFSIMESNKPLNNGPVQASGDFQLRLQTANLNIGRMAIFYTTKTDSRLTQKFAGMPLKRALKMVDELSDIDGILIQSDQEAWFAIDKRAIKK